jgi:hypothetical protein
LMMSMMYWLWLMKIGWFKELCNNLKSNKLIVYSSLHHLNLNVILIYMLNNVISCWFLNRIYNPIIISKNPTNNFYNPFVLINTKVMFTVTRSYSFINVSNLILHYFTICLRSYRRFSNLQTIFSTFGCTQPLGCAM